MSNLVALITDSVAWLPPERPAQFGIGLVPAFVQGGR